MSAPTPDAAALWRAAQAWLAEDPDPDTRAELGGLLEAGDVAAVAERFAGRLEFGTAGLRGPLGAGPRRMNRSVVIRAAGGLAAYLTSTGGRSVVVGFDARHKSDVFARDTACVMAGAGLRAMVLPRPLPTPVLAFAIRHLGADAGVMVTASHNPPQDNGYKVYLGDGAQIVAPVDAEIAAAIERVGALADVPRDDDWVTLDGGVVDAYLERVTGLLDPSTPRRLRLAYTPLHGVGRDVVLAALARAGFAAATVVDAQAEPDPDFPTVAFPNPEEPGAIDLALATARDAAADLVLANDPDADRCAVALPDATAADGWRRLTGDEVGVLLATHLLSRDSGPGHAGPGGTDAGVLATTIVSSSLLGRIAQAHGVGYAETLTGFKWLSRVPGLRYAYEEALGYCCDPGGVRDKDGISAALLVAEMAAALQQQGRTLLDVLDDLARRHGVHVTDQVSLRVADLSVIAGVMARLRRTPPAAIGGLPVTQVDDLSTGQAGLPPTDALRYRLGEQARVIVRPSGTEPKLKCYLEAVTAVADGDLAGSRARAVRTLAALRRDLSTLFAEA